MNARYILIFLAMLLAPLAPLLATTAQAADATTKATQSIQISPPTANFAGNPGENVRGLVKVTNLTDTPITLKVGKQNFVAKGEEGEIELVDNANPLYSLAPWFNPALTDAEIPARGTREVPYNIDIPVDAEPGGRYGAIVFNTSAPKLPGGVSGAAVQQNIAGIVFLRINGDAREELKVASFKSDKSFYEYGPVAISTRVQNTGTVHEKATGTITIKNMFGLTVSQFSLDEHFVIPNATRLLENTWPPKGKPGLMFGRYTAQLDAKYGDGQTLKAQTAFTVIPYKIVIAVLLGLIVLIFLIRRGRGRLGRALRILAGRE